MAVVNKFHQKYSSVSKQFRIYYLFFGIVIIYTYIVTIYDFLSQRNTLGVTLGEVAKETSDEAKEILDGTKILKHITGSFSNCVAKKSKEKDSEFVINPMLDSYSGTVQAACHQIKYHVPTLSFQASGPVIVGVLSNASIDGRIRRQAIRKTWAKNRKGVFFLVAGPWDQIRDEYNRRGDMIWIDEDEMYNGEHSVLTFKSYSFLSIVHILTKKLGLEYSHVFKTDDDSYVDYDGLVKELAITVNDENGTHVRDYVGHCQMENQPVVRDESYKWSLTMHTYPENYLPRYCQGAGYAVSQKFINCAHTQKHIANVRFMPFEDAAIGILAERCGISPALTTTGKIKLSRYESQEARDRVRKGDLQTENLVPIAACMTNRIIQHRVIDVHDMEDLHRTAIDPKYCKVTRRVKGKKIKKMESMNLNWFG